MAVHPAMYNGCIFACTSKSINIFMQIEVLFVYCKIGKSMVGIANSTNIHKTEWE